MATHPDPAQFVEHVAAEDSAVAGYLVEEVLNTLPAAMRSFLLRTSILDQVNADLASELASAGPATDFQRWPTPTPSSSTSAAAGIATIRCWPTCCA